MNPREGLDLERAAIRAELARIRRVREQLEEELARRRSQRPVSADAQLVAVVGACTGLGRVFYVAGVITASAADPGLLAALQGHGASTAECLGVRLRLLATREDLGALVVKRHGRDRGGVRWSIERAERIV